MRKRDRFTPAYLFSAICALALGLGLVPAETAFHNDGPVSPLSEAVAPPFAPIVSRTEVSPALQAEVAENYGKLPLSFEANQGQSDRQVKFLSRGRGYTLFLTGDEAVLTLQRSPLPVADRDKLSSMPAAQFLNQGPGPAVLRMKMVGANRSAKISGAGEREGRSNYFIGNDSSQWHTNVPNFANVRYQNAYPGVDLVYYGNQQQLEYDFVVAPGADPRTIALDIASDSAADARHPASTLRVAENGDLLIPTDNGEVRFRKPIVYQPQHAASLHTTGGNADSTEARNYVDARWVLRRGNQVGFEVAAYDASRPLVIDPVLSYSTYIGGSNTDGAFGVSIDSAGSCYVVGFTNSPNFPTKNPVQKTLAGGIDTFVLKLNRTGTALVYSTYLGGNNIEYPFAVGVDSTGDAYVLGNTGSANYPTTVGAFQTHCASCSAAPDVYLTKLNPTGSALVYSTFLGGSGDDRAFGIALDSSNNAYIIGWTTSTNFPVSAGAFQTQYGGGLSDAFVTVMNAAGTDVVYSTYLGGFGQDIGFGMAVDTLGDAFVTGYSYSPNFPVTVGAFQTTTTVNGAAWVTKLNPTGTALVYSTYLGGTDGTSAGNSIKVDAPGNAYITGYTCASDFPTTASAFQKTYGGACTAAGGDGFVTKLNPTGSATVFSSYLGGSGDDVGFSIGLDQKNNVYVTGRTASTNYPVTAGAFQKTNAGAYDTMFTIVNPTGTTLLYSTYLGGSAVDVAFVMAVDKPGNAYIIGRTYSINFPVTPGAFQPTLKGLTNAIVFKFGIGNQVWPTALNFGNSSVGVTTAPQTTSLTNSGSAPITITSVALSGAATSDYSLTNNCGTSLDPGASCSASVTFTPTTDGSRAAILIFTDSSTNSPQSVMLSGTGSSSSVSLTPSTLSYALQVINTTSAAQPATLTNTGTVAANITSISTTGTYSETNNCPAVLDIAASCTIDVSFTPTAAGLSSGTLTVTADGGQQTVTITGVGTVVSFSPTTVNFGSLTVGSTSAPQNITMTNLGTSTLSITNIFISGARTTSFAQTNNCGTSLAAGASCTISVTFIPKLKGALTANVSVMDNGGGAPQNITLAGSGT